MLPKSMLGEQYGLLTVIGDERGQKVACRCECGNVIDVFRGNLRRGNTKACGCTRRKTCAERMAKINLQHGMYGTKIYETWGGIVDRTTRPSSNKYAEYGAKGVTVHPAWLVFENFYAYMGDPPSPQHTVDRIKNEKGYEPGNVRWATKKEQALNRRTTKFVQINGQILSLTDAAAVLGVAKCTTSKWLKEGKLTQVPAPEIDAASQPVRARKMNLELEEA